MSGAIPPNWAFRGGLESLEEQRMRAQQSLQSLSDNELADLAHAIFRQELALQSDLAPLPAEQVNPMLGVRVLPLEEHQDDYFLRPDVPLRNFAVESARNALLALPGMSARTSLLNALMERTSLELVDYIAANPAERSAREDVALRILGCLEAGVRELNLSPCEVSQLPDCLAVLRSFGLEALNLTNVPIRHLPNSVQSLSNLVELRLQGTQIEQLPDWIGEMRSLHTLDLSDTPLRALPNTFHQLSGLRELNLTGCRQLHYAPPQLPRHCRVRSNGNGPPPARVMAPGGPRPDIRARSYWAEAAMADLERPADHAPLPGGGRNEEQPARVMAPGGRQPDIEPPSYWFEEHAPLPGAESIPFASALALYGFAAGVPQPPGANLQQLNLSVDRSQLQRSPRTVLHSLAAQLMHDPKTSIRVTFTNERAIDAGGVRKTLWSDLTAGLFQEPPTSDHLPAIRDISADKPEGDGWIPQIREELAEADRAALVDLGALIGFGARQNPALLISSVMDPVVWRALHKRIQGASDAEVVVTLLKQPYLESLTKNPETWTEQDVENLTALAVDALGLEPPPEDLEMRNEWVEEVRRHFIPNHRRKLAMIDGILEGLEKGAPGLVDELHELDEFTMVERLQGRISTEDLKRALRCTALNAGAPVGSNPELEERMAWFQRWIDAPLEPDQGPEALDQRAGLEDKARRGLVYAITGREALLPGEHINVVFIEGQSPNCHTCFNAIDLPLSLNTEEEFRKELRAISGLTGLNAA